MAQRWWLNEASITRFKTLVASQRIKMRYSIEPGDRIYVKGYGFLSFAKNMGKVINMVKNFLTVLKYLQQMQ